MGLDPEYSARWVCPVDGCNRDVEYAVSVQWSLFDFLDDGSCLEHLSFTVRYWRARIVDGREPVIDVDLVLW